MKSEEQIRDKLNTLENDAGTYTDEELIERELLRWVLEEN